MSRVPDEHRSWPTEAQGDDVLVDLRRQLEAVKARLEEHRAVMQAAGLTRAPDDEGSEPSG